MAKFAERSNASFRTVLSEWEPLLAEMLALLARNEAPSELRLLDITFFKLGTGLMSRRWNRQFAPEAAGIKLTVAIAPANCAPVDYNPGAPDDEWSGDIGCGALYFSQQCVGRLAPVAGIESENMDDLPTLLEEVQALHTAGDERAVKIFQTMGVYLGYSIAHYADFYDISDMLILGRCTSGEGGPTILEGAQVIAAASLPELA